MLSKQISTRLTRLSHLNPLSIFITVKLQLVMDLHPFLQQALAGRALLSPSFQSFTFPISSFVLWASFKSSSVSPSWIRASCHRHSFRRERTASAGLRCQAMTPASLIAPPAHPSQSQPSSNVAAGYLANHAKLMLVLLKPGDYGGISSLFVCLNA